MPPGCPSDRIERWSRADRQKCQQNKIETSIGKFLLAFQHGGIPFTTIPAAKIASKDKVPLIDVIIFSFFLRKNMSTTTTNTSTHSSSWKRGW
jgi:hypothetical protein